MQHEIEKNRFVLYLVESKKVWRNFLLESFLSSYFFFLCSGQSFSVALDAEIGFQLFSSTYEYENEDVKKINEKFSSGMDDGKLKRTNWNHCWVPNVMPKEV